MKKPVTLSRAFVPIIFLLSSLGYGLIIQPYALGHNQMPLEVIFMLATAASAVYLFYLGWTWNEIQDAMVNKIATSLPVLMILFSIGILIGSWVVSGTIPMLIYYGIEIINPRYFYLVAFVAPIIFSTSTGTSWGSAGTIGVVLIGIAHAIGADLAITAGAVVGGAYFGDKISPLSDTTNVEALATGVDLYEHIRSMLNTTVPSTIIAGTLYFLLGFVFPPSSLTPDAKTLATINSTLGGLHSAFDFNILLLLPLAIVFYGAWTKKPTVPTIFASSLLSILLALIFQKFHADDVFMSLCKGFNTNFIYWDNNMPPQVAKIVNRGGLYNLIEAITVSLLVFCYIGLLDQLNALPLIIGKIFGFVRTRSQTIATALTATAITNALTSNQFATSFIVGAAFADKFDKMKIPRKVLSRSLADTGTMFESMLPWTTTGIYMSTTLGVAVMEYNHWQLLTLTNIVVAYILAWTGWGCFYKEVGKTDTATTAALKDN